MIAPAAETSKLSDNRYQPLVTVFGAACIGIAIDRFSPQSEVRAWWAALALWPLWFWLWRRGKLRLSALLLCLMAAGIGAAWHHACWNLFRPDELSRLASDEPQPAAVEAIALSGPRQIPAPPANPLQAVAVGPRTRLHVRLVAVRNGRQWVAASGRALLLVDGKLPGVHSGDRLRIFAMLTAVEPPKNPGDLNFAEFVRGERRFCLLRGESPACISRMQQGSPWTLRRGLEELRFRGDKLLWRHVSHERAGLAAALMLGAREQLDADQTEAFVRTGTIHVLAISGMHVAILASCLFFALRLGLLRRKIALVAVAAATVLYTVLTDLQPSAVRAMILVVLVCAALFVGRSLATFNWWAAGGLLVLALNPADLFRAGPQLSFLAVAVMSWFAPLWTAWHRLDPLDRLIVQTRPWPAKAARWLGLWIGRATLVSLAIWLVTAPLVMARFHLLSPIAVLLSTLLIVPSGIALMSGFGVLIFGLLQPLGWIFGRICEYSLWSVQYLVANASRVPGGYAWVPGPPEWWLAGFYLGLCAWAAWPQLRSRRRLCFNLLISWVMLGFLPTKLADWQRTKLECTYVSVGHGCCTVLRFPDGRTILYDAGRLGTPAVGARSIAGYLWSQGILRLDAVVISHADVDHYNALPDLLEQFPVDTIYVSPRMFQDDVEPLRMLRRAIDDSGADVCEVAAGDEISLWHDALFRVLHPPQAGVSGSDNANSIVLLVEFKGRRIVLPGDLEAAGMQALLAQPPNDCDVLMAPHHGSTRSNPPGIAAWSRPEWVVISGGHEEQVSIVRGAYASRGARVLHTASGAVQFLLDKKGIEVRQWKRGEWHDDL